MNTDEKTIEQVEEFQEELDLEMTDEELLKLTKQWKGSWEKVEEDIKKRREDVENYYMGKHIVETGDNERPLVDNLLFEALETFLPMATRKNPDPLVVCNDTPEGKEFAEKIAKKLASIADEARLKLKIKRAVRFWALYFLGVAKMSWSEKEKDMVLEIIRPQKLILDADAYIDDCMTYNGEFVGEYKQDTISELKAKFPDKKEFLNELAEKMGGTKITYIEWWTDDYLFWTYKEKVLGKTKNPHWNYEYQDEIIDNKGKVAGLTTIQPFNHFKYRQKPYIFLSVFNLNKHPFDETSLIEQSLPLQDVVNKRQHQIDKNVDEMNNGWIIGGSVKNKEEATEIVNTLRDGGAVFLPDQSPRESIDRISGVPLPSDVFNHLVDARNELRNIFGVRGSSPQGTVNEKTVGGKVIIKEQDSSRVGGGIAEYIEQFVDKIYNWMVQMMCVYYDEEKTTAIIGREGQINSISISKENFEAYGGDIKVSVKEGSLIPKDPMNEANEALMLAQSGLLDPITMFDKLDFSNPTETAKRLYTWQAAPQLMFPEIGMAVETEQDIKNTKSMIAEKEKGLDKQGANKENSPSS